jgi:hypothetical protein
VVDTSDDEPCAGSVELSLNGQMTMEFQGTELAASRQTRFLALEGFLLGGAS